MARNTITATAVMTTIVALIAGCAESGGELPLEPEPVEFASTSSTLLECPVNETRSVTDTLDILGGSIELDGHAITLPYGAVLTPTVLTLTEPAGSYVELDIHANDEESFSFEEPVSIRISYDRCTRSNVENDVLTAWHIDEETKALLEHMGGTDDKTARAVTFSSDHLSGFAIAN